ncbi:uncharacterized protein LOC110020557 isoform X2 [Phalaenopsis equestris]|uniref:uncharacterized protein LOC110020557 isoform X2 n=1 Tax=Phalaenopsis equestris TaxID=78828 RepID=UPI0009E23799|nr:uncharacterized protein LOC110020557 isoform X2 [Phalaenopsis equestris]
MLENSSDNLKRFGPPTQRNRSLNRRKSGGWAAAIHSYNDQSIDLSERPIMYSGASGTSWGHLKLPHQMDFAAELRRAINNAQSNVTAISGGHS